MWSKDATAWIGGLISTDGCITKVNHRHQGWKDILVVYIVYSIEDEWISQVTTNLDKWGIIYTINDGGGKNNVGRFRGIRMTKYLKYPKRRGPNQHEILRGSIEHWGLQDLMMKRKYDVLLEHLNGHGLNVGGIDT